MPSSVGSSPKYRSLTSGAVAVLRGQKFKTVPDFFVPVNIAAADFSGATSGIWVFAVPKPAMFLGAQTIWEVAGTNTFRVKKVLSAATSAPGAAADADNVDLTAVIDLTASANVLRDVAPVTTSLANQLAAGDKVALASTAGTASLVGGLVILQFVWL